MTQTYPFATTSTSRTKTRQKQKHTTQETRTRVLAERRHKTQPTPHWGKQSPWARVALSLYGAGDSTARLDKKSGRSVACSLVVCIGSILPSIAAADTLALVNLALSVGSDPLILAPAARTKPGRGRRGKNEEKNREGRAEGKEDREIDAQREIRVDKTRDKDIQMEKNKKRLKTQ